MAISAATVWEVRASGASDNNGGGFVAGSGGTDRSQQTSAQVAVGGGVVTSSITTTVVTFTGNTYTVLAGDVGNIVQFISGTNVTAGFYQITSVTAGLNGTWTLDRTPLTAGTTTNAVANMGGALATLGKLSGAMIGGNKAYCTGAFTTNATITFAQASVANSTTPPSRLIGYGAVRGDTTHATLTLQTNTGLTGLNFSANGWSVEQMDVDCASLGTSIGFTLSAAVQSIQDCKAANFTTRGFLISGANQVTINQCEATGGTSAATSAIGSSTSANITRCFVHDNACVGITLATTNNCAYNLVVNNTGASTDGIQISGACTLLNNTIHNNGRHGVNNTGVTYSGNHWRNNILSNNGGFGIVGNAGSVGATELMDGNAYFSNSSGARSNIDSVTGIFSVTPYTNVLDVTLSVSPYVGPTTGTAANFALNNAGGGGLACKAVGSPGTFPGNTGTTSYLDMGAVQSKGGSPGIIMAAG